MIKHCAPYKTALRIIEQSELSGRSDDVLATVNDIADELQTAYKAGYEKARTEVEQQLSAAFREGVTAGKWEAGK